MKVTIIFIVSCIINVQSNPFSSNTEDNNVTKDSNTSAKSVFNEIANKPAERNEIPDIKQDVEDTKEAVNKLTERNNKVPSIKKYVKDAKASIAHKLAKKTVQIGGSMKYCRGVNRRYCLPVSKHIIEGSPCPTDYGRTDSGECVLAEDF